MASHTNSATDPTPFPYSDDELRAIGVLDEDAPELAKNALELMRKHPDLFKPNIWSLQCAMSQGKAPASATSPTLSESFTAPTSKTRSEASVMSEHAPSTNYERFCYYNGITSEGDCPELLYRSDYLTRPFPRPTGRFAKAVVKSVHGAGDTALSKIWDIVSDSIRDIIKAGVAEYSTIGLVSFYSHGPDGFVHNPDAKKDGGSFGPAVIWVGVPPGSASPDTAHNVSQNILEFLTEKGVDDAVVEWTEAVVSRL